MRAEPANSRLAADRLTGGQRRETTVRGKLVATALASLLAGTSAAAHPVERANAIDEVPVELTRNPIRIPHHAGQLDVSFRPASGSMRAELSFRGQPPSPAHLHVPLSNGSYLNVDFRGERGRMRSSQPLARLVDGTLLDIAEPEGVHRLVLRDATGRSGVR